MPTLENVLREEDLQRGRAGSGGLDLAPYLEMIDTIRAQGGVGALITLEEGERQRAEKRRLSLAAKDQGYQLIWRTAPEGRLRFVLATPGEPTPGGRQRRTPAERQAEQLTINAVMTPDVAEVTDTNAAVESSVPKAKQGRRRKAR